MGGEGIGLLVHSQRSVMEGILYSREIPLPSKFRDPPSTKTEHRSGNPGGAIRHHGAIIRQVVFKARWGLFLFPINNHLAYTTTSPHIHRLYISQFAAELNGMGITLKAQMTDFWERELERIDAMLGGESLAIYFPLPNSARSKSNRLKIDIDNHSPSNPHQKRSHQKRSTDPPRPKKIPNSPITIALKFDIVREKL